MQLIFCCCFFNYTHLTSKVKMYLATVQFWNQKNNSWDMKQLHFKIFELAFKRC